MLRTIHLYRKEKERERAMSRFETGGRAFMFGDDLDDENSKMAFERVRPRPGA